MKFRLATWNLDHASNNGRPVDRQIEQIGSIDADIWVLSETCDKVDLARAGYRSATPERRNKYGSFWTTVWARLPYSIGESLPVHDDDTVTCVEIGTPRGALMVYGTIITWHGDRGADQASPNWVEHHKEIDAQGDDWARLRELHPDRPLVVAGDFNQTRDGSRKYCSADSVERLSAQLDRNDLACVTEEDFGKAGKLTVGPKKGSYRHNIDHICLAAPLQAMKVGVWDHFTGEHELSDHNGVFADLIWHP
jgi:endonuclease/exonuclease/phosphatase family metal-dependent hydrolase